MALENSDNVNAKRSIFVLICIAIIMLMLIVSPSSFSRIQPSQHQQQRQASASSQEVKLSEFGNDRNNNNNSKTRTVSLSNLMKALLMHSVSDDWKNMFSLEILQPSSISLFDPKIFPCYEEMKNTNWEMMQGLYGTAKDAPSCFKDLESYTKSIQFFISIGLSRIANDRGLSKFYEKIQQDGDGHQKYLVSSFEMKISQMIVSYLQSASIALQVWIDANHPNMSPETMLNSLRSAKKVFSAENGNSKIILRSDDEDDGGRDYFDLVKKSSSSSSSSTAMNWLRKRSNLISLHPAPMHWNRQAPVNGRFWNNFRQTLPCSSLQRTCENPEGCRYLCNFEYSLEKSRNFLAADDGGENSKMKSILKKYSKSLFNGGDENNNNMKNGYVMVGFGSNNEFDWEDSMIEEFQKFSKLKKNNNNGKNKIGEKESESSADGDGESKSTYASGLKSITTFDCTLLTRKNPGVRPSRTVKRIKDRFRFVPFCLTGGQVPPILNFGNEQKLPAPSSAGDSSSSTSSVANAKYSSFAEVFSSPEASSKSISMAELRMVLEWKDTASSTIQNGSASSSRKSASSKINLLKIDVESFEYVSISRWLELDLYQIKKQQKQQLQKRNRKDKVKSVENNQSGLRDDSLIDFQRFPFLEVEQLQIELHRRGHKKEEGASPVSALWAMWLQMSMYALGFMPVVAEKNHFDNCCFEQVLVHYRYYVESELLMPLVV